MADCNRINNQTQGGMSIMPRTAQRIESQRPMLSGLGKFELARRLFGAPITAPLDQSYFYETPDFIGILFYGLDLRDEKVRFMDTFPDAPEPILPNTDLPDNGISQTFGNVEIAVIHGAFQWRQTGAFSDAARSGLLQTLATNTMVFDNPLWDIMLSPEDRAVLTESGSANA